MTQLVLDTTGLQIVLPESIRDGYHAEREPLSVDVEMVSGRLVRELRGNVWRIRYQYGYFDTEMKDRLILACEKGRQTAICCGFLPPTASDGMLLYRDFLVTAFSYPRFQWSRLVAGAETAAPLWADFSVELREVRPGD